jgi:flagellar protein FliS
MMMSQAAQGRGMLHSETLKFSSRFPISLVVANKHLDAEDWNMYRPQNGLSMYNRVASMETDPIQQIVMLYNGAIKFFHLAATDIEAKDFVAKAEHTRRALDIISYLQSILDFERGDEVAQVLDALYTSITGMALQASMTLDAQMMRRAAELLVPVCEAWALNANASALQNNQGRGANMPPATHASYRSQA